MLITNELIKNRKLFNPKLNNFIICCHSYYTIMPLLRILELIRSTYSVYNVTILVNLPSLRMFLTRVFHKKSNISIDYIGYERFSFRKPQRYVKEIATLFKFFIKYRNITNTNIIFASRYYILHEYFIISILRHRRSNHFCYIDVYTEDKHREQSIHRLPMRKKIKLWICKVVYGKRINYYSMGNFFYLGLDINYISTFNIIREKELNVVTSNFTNYKIDVPYEIIYFDQSIHTFDDRIIDRSKFRVLILEIFEKMRRAGINREKIGIKFHPGGEKYLSLLEYGHEIDRIIPAELLNLVNCKVIFTTFSTVLGSIEVDGIKISIIDLLPWKDKNTHSIYRKSQIENLEDQQMCFVPKSIEEFMGILSPLVVSGKT